MSETRPPGDTFEQRWPDEVAETQWLAGPWIPIVFGGLAGFFGLPMILAAVVLGWWPSLAVMAGLLGLATLGLTRTHGGPQRWSGRLWRVMAWSLLAAVLGIALGALSSLLCAGEVCPPGRSILVNKPVASLVVFGLTIAGSMGIAVVVDRTARRLAGMR